MNYIIVDLEATCWNTKPTDGKKRQNEIIEIGAVKVNSSNNIVSEFNIFVKPFLNPILSEFCTTLTGITQDQVDNGVDFNTAYHKFIWWCGDLDGYKDDEKKPKPTPFYLCSWGHYDKNQFLLDTKFHGIDQEDLKNHISIKHQYSNNVCGINKRFGMKAALKREGFELEGRHHSGLDDAKNITKIFQKYFNRWDYGNKN